jgi:hypothetical protein
MPYAVGMATQPKSAGASIGTVISASQKPKCFVIIQIGKDGSDARRKSDRVLKYIIAKALEEKYQVQRADDIKQPGTVTVQIIEQLLEAPLVVADLSDFNANVYYELAIRHAVKKPVIHLITKGQEAPFDVSQMRYVSYDITAPESVEEAQQELRANVEAIEKGEQSLTPIQFTQFVLAAQAGQAGSPDTGVILNAVGTAMRNISEELKSIKELVAKTSQPHSGPIYPSSSIFSDPHWRPPDAPFSDVLSNISSAAAKASSPEETMNTIAKAAAAIYEKNEKEKKKG